MTRTGIAIAALAALPALLLASCRRAADQTPAPAPPPLAPYAAQRLVLTPTGLTRSDSLGWVARLGGARAAARRLDSAFVAALAERDLGARWILPAELARSYERNRTYAADPYQLALEQVRSAAFATASRYGEPLSTQLRTMIALHDDARFVLLPIELRFEREGTGGRGVLRAALLDPRFAEARWVGELKGEAAAAPEPALASVARRFADLFVAP